MNGTNGWCEPESRTVAARLQQLGVCVEVGDPERQLSIAVDIPRLPGWVERPSTDLPAATVLVNPSAVQREFTPNAVLLHGRLSERVDSEWLLDGAFEDSRLLPNWREYEASRSDFLGCRSAFVRGCYTAGTWVLQATTRYLVIDALAEQYLTQLTVTTLASQIDELDADVTVLNLGLQIDRR
ncbi:LpqN/LpqT family lipoprotein [Prescottella equi]|uniref:LpqN/LpqT family lipoprotein n=1 Tax=Rhodococcus hoagii TaxID=43767 RepID=UPI001EEA9DE7|nr:LpqN/LpqT family lipoprotein [Prescottella equi]